MCLKLSGCPSETFLSVNKYTLVGICSDCNHSNCRCDRLSDEPYNDYDLPTLYDLSDCDYNYNSSLLFDENLENNIYKNATIENNVHDKSSNIESNVHDLILPSVKAHCMMNLGLKKKGFKMGHLNIQGIQNKSDQIDLMLNSTENDILLLGLRSS